ncbi:inactive serine protease PAMR1-like isoform X2 [Sipha flava]|uniref:limulus clotting factor C n=1 Tax=Sipha flava TaxID=143950 RepID=A0A8B8FFF8_9HEMI|nr:inactive serine protease PAMR1-like isoform X2 [Sipha flava]
MGFRVFIVVYACCCCWLSSARGNVIDPNAVPMTLLNATNFIMRHQRYLLQDDDDRYAAAAATGVHETSENEVNMNVDGNVEHVVNSPLVLNSEVCDPGKCQVGEMEGLCISGESCFKHGGQIGNPCNGSSNLFCCTFLLTCGDVSNQKITYLQSPDNLKTDTGSLACDYDLIVQKDTCAVRVDYEKVNLASKIGGVCDIDQVYILNSNDGPTSGQCGALSGYSTVVAVKPNQEKPLKIAIVVQSEPAEYWLIKVSQISCAEIKPFKESPDCGKSSIEQPLNDGRFDEPPSPHLTPSSGTGHCDGRTGPDRRRLRGHQKSVEHHTAAVLGRWSRSAPPTTALNVRGGHRRRTPAKEQRPEFLDSGGSGGGGSTSGGENRRIIGGTDAAIGEHTWQVAIALNGLFFCGGALIDDQFVITAAHCVMTRNTPMDDLTIHLGDYDLTADNETEHQVRKVSRVMFHSHFHPFLLDNDIALLRLDRPVFASKTVRPVCLPSAAGGSYVGEKGTVLGWGVTSFPFGDPSPTLQKIAVEVLSNFQCSRVIEDHVGLGMLCAAAPSLQGTCFGDSGGPLTVERDTGQNVLIGLVSYGVTGCAVKSAFPDLYTRISEYTKWIDVSTSL